MYQHCYSYKPNPVFHETETETGTLYFGVEIETDNIDAEDIDVIGNEHENLCYCKSDCTVDDGTELVTHPCTLQYHKSIALPNIFSALYDTDCEWSAQSGCHIHGSCDSTSVKKIIHKIGYGLQSEHAQVLTAIAGRCIGACMDFNTSNCPNRYGGGLRCGDGIDCGAYSTYVPQLEYYYSACSRKWLNFSNDSTVEYRLPTLYGVRHHKQHILLNMLFLDSLIAFSTLYNDDDDNVSSYITDKYLVFIAKSDKYKAIAILMAKHSKKMQRITDNLEIKVIYKKHHKTENLTYKIMDTLSIMEVNRLCA